MCELSRNQLYRLCRVGVIALFGSDNLLEINGAVRSDFPEVMTFLSDIYQDSIKLRDLQISGKVEKEC